MPISSPTDAICTEFRIMARLRRVFLVLHAIATAAAKTTLSTELTNLIPSCAQDCFISFLDFNFALGKCGIYPTIDCLCTTKKYHRLYSW